MTPDEEAAEVTHPGGEEAPPLEDDLGTPPTADGGETAQPGEAPDQSVGGGNRRLLSAVVSTSTLTVVLAAAVYDWQAGWRQGAASRLGIAVEFVPASSDPAATPAAIVVFSLLALIAVGVLATLVPALTGWPVFGVTGVYELLRAIVAAIRGEHPISWWFHLAVGVALLILAALVEALARLISRMLKRRQQQRSRRRWAQLLLRLPSSRLPPRLDNLITTAQVLLVVAVVAWAALLGAEGFGRWLGRLSAAPDQAVITGGHTYAWLGTTPDGLIVARSADFCGSQPEDARHVVIAGRRSQVIKTEGVEVIRLSPKLRLVSRCP